MLFISSARAITREAESHGYSVVPSICGHGIGRDFHEYPEIMHSGKSIELFFWFTVRLR